MPDLRLAYTQSNESMLRDIGVLRQALPQPSIALLRYLKVPFLGLVMIASLPVGGYAGTITGLGWIGPIVWSGAFLFGWQVWHLVIVRWAMRLALREFGKLRPERSTEVQVDEIGIQFTDEMSQLRLKWECVQTVIPAKHGIGIVADMTTYYVPAAAFQTDDMKASFVETVRLRMRGSFDGSLPTG